MKETVGMLAAGPSRLRHLSGSTLLLMRVVVGAFLVWGVADNILSAERMREFETFLAHFGFPAPWFMAPLSVWIQFLVGVLLAAGFLTRWAGLICAVHFLVAIVMVDAAGGIRAAFPSACLVVVGLHLAATGGGPFALDRLFSRP